MSSTLSVQEVDRRRLQPWLPQLDAWLLPGAFYGVQHTWPQLYRSDGGGRFFVITAGDELLSHCALRTVTVHGAAGAVRVNLLGSVVTSPEHRGQGLAGQVLGAALSATAADAAHTLLWAEQEGLYARRGFVPGRAEVALMLARRPRSHAATVRPATLADHAALFALHEQKPWRTARTATAMSGLLTTPGLQDVRARARRPGHRLCVHRQGRRPAGPLARTRRQRRGCRRTAARGDAPRRPARCGAAAARRTDCSCANCWARPWSAPASWPGRWCVRSLAKRWRRAGSTGSTRCSERRRQRDVVAMSNCCSPTSTSSNGPRHKKRGVRMPATVTVQRDASLRAALTTNSRS